MKFNKNQKYRNAVNYQIKAPTVRLFKGEEQLGIVPTEKARRMAQEAGLDLVEVSSKTYPPVCKIIDFGKFKFEQDKRDKDLARKQREMQIQIKEIRLRPKIDVHDIEIKAGQATRFLSEGKKVQLSLMFRGREMAHQDQGFAVVKELIQKLGEVSEVERPVKMEGRSITCLLRAKN